MAPAKKSTTKKAPAAKKAAPRTKKTEKVAPVVGSLAAPVYSASGKEVRTVSLPESVFGAPKNDTLVYQVVNAFAANARTPIAHTKTRGEVRGGGKKPWKQKGTGRARHGSSRSPIWKGGGITFGPRNDKDYSQKVNKKMRARALATALSSKFASGSVLLVDAFPFVSPKTKDAKAALATLSKVSGFEALSTRRNKAALIVLGNVSAPVKKSFANMGNVEVTEARTISVVDVLSYKFILVVEPEAALETLTARMK